MVVAQPSNHRDVLVETMQLLTFISLAASPTMLTMHTDDTILYALLYYVLYYRRLQSMGHFARFVSDSTNYN